MPPLKMILPKTKYSVKCFSTLSTRSSTMSACKRKKKTSQIMIRMIIIMITAIIIEYYNKLL